MGTPSFCVLTCSLRLSPRHTRLRSPVEAQNGAKQAKMGGLRPPPLHVCGAWAAQPIQRLGLLLEKTSNCLVRAAAEPGGLGGLSILAHWRRSLAGSTSRPSQGRLSSLPPPRRGGSGLFFFPGVGPKTRHKWAAGPGPPRRAWAGLPCVHLAGAWGARRRPLAAWSDAEVHQHTYHSLSDSRTPPCGLTGPGRAFHHSPQASRPVVCTIPQAEGGRARWPGPGEGEGPSGTAAQRLSTAPSSEKSTRGTSQKTLK